MENKKDKTRNAGEGKDKMVRSTPNKRPTSLWEWQRYVKRETQRLMKGQENKPKIEPEPPARIERPVIERDDKLVSKETPPVAQHRTSFIENRDIEPIESVIPAEEFDEQEFDQIDEIEQDLDALMEASEVEYDDDLRDFVQPQFEPQKPLPTPQISKPIKHKLEPKSTAKEQTKAKPDKAQTIKLFEEGIEKARTRKRNPKRTREHIIENLLDPIISLDEAAVILNVCKTTVRRYTNSGKLECIRTPGNQRRFKLSTVLEFLEEKEGHKGTK